MTNTLKPYGQKTTPAKTNSDMPESVRGRRANVVLVDDRADDFGFEEIPFSSFPDECEDAELCVSMFPVQCFALSVEGDFYSAHRTREGAIRAAREFMEDTDMFPDEIDACVRDLEERGTGDCFSVEPFDLNP